MKKLIILLGIVILVIFLPILIQQFSGTTPVDQTTVVPDEQNPEETSLRAKVGQLFLIGHWSYSTTIETANLVDDLQLGGVIIMDSTGDPRKIAGQTEVWQNAAYPTPLLVGIDQEGGVVSRLKDEIYISTPQPEIETAEDAYSVANLRARALKTLGINANFAPVMDQSTNPESFMYERVFHNPSMIASLSDAMIRGYQNSDVVAVPKHFPGHPDTTDDSHFELPSLELTKTEYEAHTKAFKEVVEAGNMKMLMTAHLKVPALDPELPVTLSPAILSDLRNRIGFDGVIITDDLAMRAIRDTWSYEESAVLALKAGADMIMLAAEPEVTSRVINAVIEAIESKELSKERIDEAYQRVMEVKKSL